MLVNQGAFISVHVKHALQIINPMAYIYVYIEISLDPTNCPKSYHFCRHHSKPWYVLTGVILLLPVSLPPSSTAIGITIPWMTRHCSQSYVSMSHDCQAHHALLVMWPSSIGWVHEHFYVPGPVHMPLWFCSLSTGVSRFYQDCCLPFVSCLQ